MAETVLLKTGGKVEGQIIKRPESPDTGTYIVKLDEGIHVRLEANQVGRIEELTDAEQQYERLLPTMPDTARGHEAMAKWCRENSLDDQSDFHWQQVLRLQPDHEEARRMLGFDRRRGEWMKPEEFMAHQGYVRYKGNWRLPQQVAVMEQAEQIELLQKQWRRDIRTWRSWLGGRRHEEAVERLQGIDDPLAAAGLSDLLAEEKDVDVRILYVDILGRFQSGVAYKALIDTALADDESEVRLRCLEHLAKNGREQAVGAFIASLSSSSNRIINRAAAGLEQLGTSEAIMPLINALVSQHQTIIKPGPNIRPSFGSSSDGSAGLGGLSVGGGPKKIIRDVQNQNVLKALVELTDQNYGYSEGEWKDWYVQSNSLSPSVNLRRDE